MNKNLEGKNDKRNLAKKIIKYLLITLIIIAAIIVVSLYLGNRNARLWINKNILKRDIGEEDLPSIEINSQNSKVFAYSDKVAILENGTLSIYNSSAKKISDIQVSMANPIYKTAGEYLLIADEGGNSFYLINDESLQWKKTIDGQISKITVNKNGAVGIVVTGTTYKSILIMYDISGNENFRTYLATTLATDIAISNNSRFLSFIEINTTGASIISKVKTISVDKAKNEPKDAIIYTYELDSNVLAIKLCYSGDDIKLMTDVNLNKLKDGNLQKIDDFSDDISFADITLDNNMVEIKENKSKAINADYEVDFINDENQKVNVYYFQDAIKSMVCYGSNVALNFGNEIEFVNTRGNLVKKYTSLKNIKDIQIADKIAAIIYKDNVEILAL